MKRTFKYALSAVLGAMLVVPALAQDQFPDVPENHWAYKDLAELKAAGLLVGYPDPVSPKYRGGRPASRYELAVAIHAVWANLKAQQDALKAQLDDLARKMDGVATKADLDALRGQVDALSAEVNRIKSEDIARLNRLMDEFRGELTKLGDNVNQMKSDLRALGDRVTKIEGRIPNFDISGDLNFVALGGYSSGHHNGITVDGRPTGVGRSDFSGAFVGATRDLTALHEGAFNIDSHNDDPMAPKFHATGVFGNMLGGDERDRVSSARFTRTDGIAFGTQSSVIAGAPFGEADESFYFQSFWVDFNTSIGGQKFNAKVGRVGYKVSPYIFQREDTTAYFSNERWDSGEWMFDGGVLGFNFGKQAKFDVFGGRVSGLTDTWGTPFQPMGTGRINNQLLLMGGGFADRPRGESTLDFPVDQLLGGNLGFNLGATGHLNLSYIWLDSNNVIDTGTSLAPELVNGTTVYGGDIKFDFSGLNISGAYSKSDTHYQGHSVNTSDDSAWTVNAQYNKANWGIGGGYRRIDPLFCAPGDWGRIGIWWNPVDIQGFTANFWYAFSPKLKISAKGEWLTGTSGNAFGDFGLGTNDRISHYTADLTYKVCPHADLLLGYEEVNWNLKTRVSPVGNNFPDFVGGKPIERWYNIGLGWELGNRAKLSMLWQISDYDSKGVGGWEPFAFSSFKRATGGLLTTQLSIRY